MKHYPPILDRLLSQLAARLSPAGIAEMCEWLDGGGADQVANVVEGSRGLTALSQRIERALESVRPDPTSEPERAAANLLAMWMLHRFSGDAMQTAAERWTLDRYTGWGGLGIKKWMPGFPPGPMPEAEGLLHEYYTPRRVWRAIWQSLAAKNYKLDGDALEPSAGIGRALAQFDHLYRHPAQLWANMGDRWCALAWPHYVALARQLMGPMQLADGEIGMRPVSDTTLPCTRAGWHRFVSLARQSTQKWSDLNAVAKAWWDRELPKGIVGRDA